MIIESIESFSIEYIYCMFVSVLQPCTTCEPYLLLVLFLSFLLIPLGHRVYKGRKLKPAARRERRIVVPRVPVRSDGASAAIRNKIEQMSLFKQIVSVTESETEKLIVANVYLFK